MPNFNCRIKIVRSGEEFEAEGDKKFVLAMLDRFQGHPSAIVVQTPRGSKSPAQQPQKGKPISVGEFIRQLGLKKHTDIVLAFGYYLETFSGLKEFAPADINACYYDAKMEASNTSQMIIQNIKRSFMMPSKRSGKGDKHYLVTQSGIDFIANNLKK